MDWMEQNIDAYRIVSEVLGELRIVIREVLERVYGDEWYRKGLPEEVFERLVAAKEREKSIDWYEGQYQQIMDYATFPDLMAILDKNEDRFPDFVNLAPSRALLEARFLELDVMRAKLGRARPISETELSFLGTFHLRFRKAAEKARTAAAGEEIGPQASDLHEDTAPPAAATENAAEDKAPDASEDKGPAASEDKPQAAPEPPPAAPEPEKPGPPRRPVQTAAGSQNHSNEDQAPSDATAEDDIQSEEIPVEGHDHGESEPDEDGIKGDQAEAGDEADPAPEKGDEVERTVGPKTIGEALNSNDHQAVLRELYHEVTAIAEGVWSSDDTPEPFVWDQVTASDWYEANFSRLGLRSLSVFYEITSKVDKKLKAGDDRNELHEYLKETNFAKTLLSLRDMFEANGI